MTWTMPRSALHLVAGAIAVLSLGAFTLGVISAPPRGRLPGESATRGGGPALEATDATPLEMERIEGPPPLKELTEEEKAALDAEKLARAEAAAEAKLAAATALPKAPEAFTPPPAPAPDPVGAILEKAPPPEEEPPF